MGLERDFAQILKEKMGFEPSAPRKKGSSPSEKPEFPSWKFQFSAPLRTFAPQKIPGVYPATEMKVIKPTPVKTEKKKAEITFKIGDIGLEYTSDLITLQALGADLDPAQLSLSSIKKEYRQLALQWHPDRKPNDSEGKNFHLATIAYGNLLAAATKLNKK